MLRACSASYFSRTQPQAIAALVVSPTTRRLLVETMSSACDLASVFRVRRREADFKCRWPQFMAVHTTPHPPTRRAGNADGTPLPHEVNLGTCLSGDVHQTVIISSRGR